MKRTKAKRIEAPSFPVEFWVWVLAQFQNQQPVSPAYLSKADAERHTPHMHISNGYRLVRVAAADPLARLKEDVVKAAIAWRKDSKAARPFWAAVERLERKR